MVLGGSDANFPATAIGALGENKIQPSLIEFKDYICGEILADSLQFVPGFTHGEQIEVNETNINIYIKKIITDGNQ